MFYLPLFFLKKSCYALLPSLLLVLAAASGHAQSSPPTGNSPAISVEPFNPAFVEYWNEVNQPGHIQRKVVTSTGHTLGKVPSPVNFSHLAQQPSPLASITLPSSYDLRALGKMTAVGAQGSCGACWTFATFGALESTLMPAEIRSFSENNLKDLHGFDSLPCDGGNTSFASAYLARWGGPVNTSDDPYQTAVTNTSPPGLPAQKHVQNINVYARRTSTAAPGWDNTILKTALMTDGALHTSMKWFDAAYNDATAAYYYSGTLKTDHDVTLAGWDDNYPVANFNSPKPPGPGAFLIKNSWGTTWGQGGYFWISYYDTMYAMTDESYSYVDAEPTTNYIRKYDYDPLGLVANYGYNNTTAWFANIFPAVASEQLAAVSFWVASNASPYTIYVYTNVTGSPIAGTLAATTTGILPLAGYHTVVLPNPVQLTAGQKFSVVVQLTTPSANNPIPIEYALANFSSQATASPGQSFISQNGNTWADTTTAYAATANVCLKAFTNGGNSLLGGSYPLIVNSTNPSSGVAITASPADNTGNGGGSGVNTSFTFAYNSSTQVTLTAPSTSAAVSGNAFGSWAGCDSVGGTGNTNCIVTMNAARVVSANYVPTFKSASSPANPLIDSLSPALVQTGSSGFTLTVNGSGFEIGAGVIWNGSDRTSSTTWVSDSQLTVPISAADIASVGNVKVTVNNPAGGGASSQFVFAVDSSANALGAFTVNSSDPEMTLTVDDSDSLPVTLADVGSNAQLSVTCYNLPVGATCSYSDGELTITSSPATPTGDYSVLATFTTTQQVLALNRQNVHLSPWTALAALPFGLLWFGRGRRRTSHGCWLVLFALLFILSLAGCGSSSITSSSTSSSTTTTITAQSSLPITLTMVDDD
jgi:C1A family cysteine protease